MLLDRTGLAEEFGVLVDASAGDWYDGEGYCLPVSREAMSPEGLTEWWLGIIHRCQLEMIEDPFAETDVASWRSFLTLRPRDCVVLGDNLTSTLPSELETKIGLIDGVLVKPDQNGTVTGTRAFAALARANGLSLVTSHRSIETDSAFLVHLTEELRADAMKIGPYSDFSSVARTNELLRGAVA